MANSKKSKQSIAHPPIDQTTPTEKPVPSPSASIKTKVERTLSKLSHNAWFGYFMSGFMVFLGVFLGFLSDNYKQKLSERKVERRNLSSYVGNLKMDVNHLSISIDSCMVWNRLMQELIQIPSEITDTTFQRQFFNYAILLKSTDNYVPNESAFNQMQTTNTLRLVTNQAVIDSILVYQTYNKLILDQQAFVSNTFSSRTNLLMEITDLRAFPHLKFNGNTHEMHLYLNHIFIESVGLDYYIAILAEQLNRANNIIDFIQKEYQME